MNAAAETRLLLAMARYLKGYSLEVAYALSAAENANENGTTPPLGEPSGAFDLEAAVMEQDLTWFWGREDSAPYGRQAVAARLKERYAHHVAQAAQQYSRVPRRDGADLNLLRDHDSPAAEPETIGAGGGDPLPQPTDVQKRIAAIEQRVNALGIEPWFYIHSPECLQPHTVAEGRRSHWRAVCSMTYNAPKCDTDARFIAEARQDVPWLLDQLARLSRVHQQLKAECVRLVDEWRIWAEKRAKQAMDFEHAQRAQMLHESCLHVIRADELEKALRLAASTTETPP